ncbi:MAG: hypothetical protein GC159_00320 [Phycisphaera sp.]|nr:hypothetical protein [Phycisphaera sp.]
MRVRRVLKWTAIVTGVLTVVLIIAALALLAMLPGIVQGQIDAQLAELGLGGSSVRVTSVGLNSAALTDLQIGSDEHLKIDSAEVSYTIGELQAGRIRTLTLSGVQMTVAIDNEGNVDIGALGRLKSGTSSGGATKLPFDRVVLRSSSILFDTPGRDLRVPLAGVIDRTDDGAFTFDLASHLFGRGATLSGGCTLGDQSVALDDVRLVLHGADLTVPSTDIVLGGARVDVQLDGVIGASAVTVNVRPGSEVELQTAFAPLHQLRMQSSNPDQRWLRLSVGKDPICVTNGSGAWTVAAHGIGLAMNSTLMSLPDQGVVLRGMRGQMSVDVDVDAKGARVKAAAGSTLSLADLRLPLQASFVGPAARRGDTAWLTFLVGDTPAVLTLPADGKTWSVDAPAATVTLAESDVVMPDIALDLRGIEAALPVTAHIDATAATLRAMPGGTITVDAAQRLAGGITSPRRDQHAAAAGDAGVAADANADTPWLRCVIGATPTVVTLPTEGAWSIASPAADVTVGDCDVVMPDIGLDVRGVHGTTSLAAQIDAKRVVVNAMAGAAFTINEGRRLPGGVKLSPPAHANAPADHPAPPGAFASLDLVERDASLTIASGDWTLAMARFRVRVNPTDVNADGGDIAIDAFRTDMLLGMTARPSAVDVSPAEPFDIHADLAAMPGLRGLTAGPIALRVAPLADRAGPVLRYAAGVTSVGASVTTTNAIDVTADSVTAHAATLAATFDVRHDASSPRPDAALRYAIDVSLDGASLKESDLELATDQITLTLPVRSHADMPMTTGAFSTGPITLAGDTHPPMRGTASVVAQRLAFDTTWQVLDNVPATATGRVDARGAQVTATLPPTDLTDSAAVGRRFKALRGVEVTGTIAADATINYVDGKLDPHAKVTLKGVRFAEKTTKSVASGIDGVVVFNGLLPLSTPATQRLKIDTIQIGQDVKFTNGDVSFRIGGVNDLFVERVRVRFGEKGWWTAHAIRYDYEAPTIATEFYIEEMNLGDWMSVLTGEKITGTGQLYGRIPIVFRPDAGRKLLFGDGYLYAKSGKGELRFRDAEMVGQLLENADPRFRANDTLGKVRGQVVEALADFEYSMFRFDLIESDGDITLRLETRGEGRTGARQELGSFVVNWNHFEQNVNTYLFRKIPPERDADRAGRSLDRFFAPIER